MESNEEKFRQFKEKIDKEMEERRAHNQLIEKSVVISICGALLGIIPYVGWLILIFCFCYCCYVLKKTLSGVAILLANINARMTKTNIKTIAVTKQMPASLSISLSTSFSSTVRTVM